MKMTIQKANQIKAGAATLAKRADALLAQFLQHGGELLTVAKRKDPAIIPANWHYLRLNNGYWTEDITNLDEVKSVLLKSRLVSITEPNLDALVGSFVQLVTGKPHLFKRTGLEKAIRYYDTINEWQEQIPLKLFKQARSEWIRWQVFMWCED